MWTFPKDWKKEITAILDSKQQRNATISTGFEVDIRERGSSRNP